jgi:hypothetical protein
VREHVVQHRAPRQRRRLNVLERQRQGVLRDLNKGVDGRRVSKLPRVFELVPEERYSGRLVWSVADRDSVKVAVVDAVRVLQLGAAERESSLVDGERPGVQVEGTLKRIHVAGQVVQAGFRRRLDLGVFAREFPATPQRCDVNRPRLNPGTRVGLIHGELASSVFGGIALTESRTADPRELSLVLVGRAAA